MKHRAIILTLMLSAVILSGTSAQAVVHDITIGNNFFLPLGTHVSPGDTVRWTWVGSPFIPHNTTSDPGSPKTWVSMTTNQAAFTFEQVFTEMDGPGPFPYKCTIHPFTMIDTIHLDPVANCCVGLTGNVDNDPNDITDITDLTVLIDHLFINFPPLDCPEEGNIDGDPAGAVDITDLTFLIDHLFINFPPTAVCQ